MFNLFNKTNFDFLAIGDIVVDDFIKLKEAEIESNKRNHTREICLAFGEKIPYDEAILVPAVGNSPNAAVCAARLGLNTALMTNLGDDNYGRLCLDTLTKAGVNTSLVKTNRGKKTNYHYVLWYGDDRTILIKHEKYDYELPPITAPKNIYLSSLGEHSLPFHSTLADYLDKHPNIKLIFQPGTYQIRFGAAKLRRIYAQTDIFFSNKEEAQRILNSSADDIETLATGLHELGPNLVFITDSRQGAYAYNGEKLWHQNIYPDPKPPISRTGAGDAFSATVSVALSLGLSITEAMKWGMVNSMSVVQQVGAQKGLLTSEKIKEYLAKAPADFQTREI